MHEIRIEKQLCIKTQLVVTKTTTTVCLNIHLMSVLKMVWPICLHLKTDNFQMLNHQMEVNYKGKFYNFSLAILLLTSLFKRHIQTGKNPHKTTCDSTVLALDAFDYATQFHRILVSYQPRQVQ
jgi:hypothetical protein